MSNKTWLPKDPPEPKAQRQKFRSRRHFKLHIDHLCHIKQSHRSIPTYRKKDKGGEVPSIRFNSHPHRRLAYLLSRETNMLAKGHKKGEERKQVNISPTPSAMLLSFPAVQYIFLFAPLIPLILTSPSESDSTHTTPR